MRMSASDEPTAPVPAASRYDEQSREPSRARPAVVNLVLLGVGAIGRELLAQLTSGGERSRRELRVCGLVDRSGYVFARDGLTRQDLTAMRTHKREGGSLATGIHGHRARPLDAVAFIASQLPSSVLVDATAADTHAMLEIVLERGWDVVLANKIPIAGEQRRDDALRALARRHGGRLFHEATVGAGLPVLDTLRKLLDTGDRIRAIEGCPSGTMGFIFGELRRGARFSGAVRAAMAAGYTEPDPRVDLSGLDVARKALILARAIGFRGDLDDVETENLLPAALRNVPLAEFLGRLHELDDEWKARSSATGAPTATLRYRVRVTCTTVRVGLAEVSPPNPMSALHDTDNQFIFTTARYDRRPLIISGPGAGPAVTAAGVYSDVVRAAAERHVRT
jgi:homoserine dehydrogenase